MMARHIEKKWGADALNKVPSFNKGHTAGITYGNFDLGDVGDGEAVVLYKTQAQVDAAVGVAHREVIQYMNHIRRHYHNWRRYTYGDLTAYYDDGYVYVQGIIDGNDLRYIYVLWLQEEDVDKDPDDGNEDPDEDDVKYPAWLVPDIKALIMKNELSFMLGRPSDDSNNATLASVKPHGPQDEEE